VVPLGAREWQEPMAAGPSNGGGFSRPVACEAESEVVNETQAVGLIGIMAKHLNCNQFLCEDRL
jgi:hypothetical protein